ncbi:MAG: hypothetical protein M3N46_07835, partial [Actinomycetota bacterium]|nr:hypothetical protein [Actinomycetota bacterium]
VIELVSGQVVRDERAGGYQTQAIPVQTFDLSGPLPTGAPTASMPTVRPPQSRTVRETKWTGLDDLDVIAEGRGDIAEARDNIADARDVDDFDDESDARPATTPIEIPVAPPRVVAAPARVTAPAQVTTPASHEPASPPPLNEPGRRA